MSDLHYHYTMSGLDNIYLVDGFDIHGTPYGDGISISFMDQLHKAICVAMLDQMPLTQQQRKFFNAEFDQDKWESIPMNGNIFCRLSTVSPEQQDSLPDKGNQS